jgi:LysM repeat protein
VRRVLLGFSLCLLLLCRFELYAASAQSDPASEIVRLVNELRASRGLPPYQVDSALTIAAQTHTDWCASNGLSTHTGAGGTTPRERALAAGYGGGASVWVTENIAHGTLPVTPEFVVMMWQGDQVHLDSMISSRYEHIGVGYAEAGGYAFYTLMAGRVGDSSPAPAQPDVAEEAPPQAEAEDTSDGQSEPGFVRATPRPDGSIMHEVQEGQSLWLIAANYGVDVADLMELNGLPEDAFLHAGDLLLIKPGDMPTAIPTNVNPTPQPAAASDTGPGLPATATLSLHLTPLPTLASTHVPSQPEPGRRPSVGVIIALAVAGVALVGVSTWQCFRLQREPPGPQDN